MTAFVLDDPCVNECETGTFDNTVTSNIKPTRSTVYHQKNDEDINPHTAVLPA